MDYFNIDANITTPLYIQITQSIKNAIERGILRYADLLPTEKDLCNAFSCSRIVAKMAYDLLVQEQYVTRVQGKGTYVSNRPTQIINIESILQIDTMGHLHEKPINRKTIFHSTSESFSRIASILDLNLSDKIIHSLRVFTMGVNPILLQSCYFPESLLNLDFPPLEDTQSFFHWIELASKQKISSVRNHVGVVGLETWEAKMLHVPQDTAAHICRGFIYSDLENPIGYVEMRLPSAAFRLEITNYE